MKPRSPGHLCAKADMKLLAIIPLTLCLVSFASNAGTPPATDVERNKAKLVSRLYQATHGASERCKSANPKAAKEFQNELTAFLAANARLMELVIQSPHYVMARERFAKHKVIDPERDTPESLASECKYLAGLLQSMTNTPEGKKAAEEYERLLSN